MPPASPLSSRPAEGLRRGADGRAASTASTPRWSTHVAQRGEGRRTTWASQVCLVIGGGNIFRGVSGAAAGMDRASADYMGMLATVMNALAMQSALERSGVPTRVQSAIPMTTVCEPYIRRRAVAPHGEGPGGDLRRRHRQSVLHHRHRRRAARRRDGLRRLLKGTQVDGVYSRRSQEGPERQALRTARPTWTCWRSDLQVMDASAISLARENRIPIIVFDIHEPGALRRGRWQGAGTFTIDHRTRADRMSADPTSRRLRRRMDGAMDALKKEFAGLRTGRASVSLLEPVMVEAYGQRMPLNQVGTVERAGAAPADGAGLGQGAGQGGRQGDPRRRPRPQPADRRPADPRAAARADRGAPQRTGQGRAQICREARASPCATSAATAWRR